MISVSDPVMVCPFQIWVALADAGRTSDALAIPTLVKLLPLVAAVWLVTMPEAPFQVLAVPRPLATCPVRWGS